jgi:hypothetical protein
MLKRIEVTNFESHVHSVLEDLHPGVNLIRGDSNSGKTALIRALKMTAYQDFDPKSVRIGTTKCEVLVKTERGTVKAIKGPKSNLWEVTPNGQPARFFDKVGKQPVPDATKIIGLNIVKLGDLDIPVNIMDQLESHFMLSSIGGKDASGSVRAQIIDEVSGLAGIEGIIKAVGLDNHRDGREIKVLEDQMETIRSQLHDVKKIEAEAVLLATAEKLLQNHTQQSALADAMFVVQSELYSLDNLIEDLENKLKKMPSVQNVRRLLDIITTAKVKIDAMATLQSDYHKVVSEIQQLELRQHDIRKKGSPAKSILAISTLIERIKDMKQLGLDLSTDDNVIRAAESRLAGIRQKMAENDALKSEILKTVQVCPLSQKPISPKCLEGI